MMTRPAQAADATQTTVAAELQGDYERILVKAKTSAQPVAAIRAAAAQYRSTASAWDPSSLTFYAPLVQFQDALAGVSTMKPADIAAAFARAFGSRKPSELTGLPELATAVAKLGAIVVTNALLGNDGAVTSSSAADLLRTIAIVRRVASNDETLGDEGAIAAARTKSILLPASIFPLFGMPLPGSAAKPAPPTTSSVDAAGLLAKRDQLLLAHAALTRIEPEHLALSHPAAAQPVAAEIARTAGAATRVTANSPATLTGRDRAAPVLLTAEAVKTFDPDEQRALEALHIDPTKLSLTSSVDSISYELGRAEASISK